MDTIWYIIIAIFCFVGVIFCIAGAILSGKKKKEQDTLNKAASLGKQIRAELDKNKDLLEQQSVLLNLASDNWKDAQAKKEAWLAAQQPGEGADPDFVKFVQLQKTKGSEFYGAMVRCKQKSLPETREYFALDELEKEWAAVFSSDSEQELSIPEWKYPECKELRAQYRALGKQIEEGNARIKQLEQEQKKYLTPSADSHTQAMEAIDDLSEERDRLWEERSAASERELQIMRLVNEEMGALNEKKGEWLAAQKEDEAADPDFAEMIRLRDVGGQAWADAKRRCREKQLAATREYFALEDKVHEWASVTSDQPDPPDRVWSEAKMERLRKEFLEAGNKKKQAAEAANKVSERIDTAFKEQRGIVLTEKAKAALEKSLTGKRTDVQLLVAMTKRKLKDITPEAVKYVRAQKEPSGLFLVLYDKNRKSYTIERTGNEILLYNGIYVRTIKDVFDAMDALTAACGQEEAALDEAIRENWSLCENFEQKRPEYDKGAAFAKVISVDDVLYYEIKEKFSPTSGYTPAPKKPGLIGTMVTEAFFGTAAATARATYNMQKAQSGMPAATPPELEATLYFANSAQQEPLTVTGTEFVEKLNQMLPEKRR